MAGGKEEETRPQTRSVEMEVEIAAPVEAVWKALTEADELTRWFPLDAGVNPDGSVWMSFDNEMRFEGRVEISEPNRRLRSIPTTPEGQDPTPIATDIFLETRAGKTALRLVHSGFSTDSNWDDLVDATRRGWRFQLGGLQHYLERHRGTPRDVAHFQVQLGQVSLDEAWRRLLGTRGFGLDQARVGQQFASVAATGDRLEGTVQTLESASDFSAVISNLNDSLLRIWLDRPLYPGASDTAYVWLSTYGLPVTQVEAIRDRWGPMIRGLFPGE